MKPSGIRKYFDIVETLEGAISLGVGEPDFVTPWEIRSAGIRSLQKGYTQYTGNRGLPELRALISRYLSERFGAEYPADRVTSPCARPARRGTKSFFPTPRTSPIPPSCTCAAARPCP